MMKKCAMTFLAAALLAGGLSGCQKSTPSPGSIAGYDEGEEYLSIWVHSIEDTDEGKCYRESVEEFNEVYDGSILRTSSLFQEMTAVEDIQTRSMHLLCQVTCRMCLR